MAEPPIIALRDVAVGYGPTPLFQGVEFQLLPGERATLVGRNGSGKTTLMKLLAGALDPDVGERFVQPGTRVAWLPQEPAFRPGETAWEHVAEADPRDPPEDYEIQAALERFGLGDLADREAQSFSGGEARRASLARALVRPPDVLLLDEPTNHLDLDAIQHLEEFLLGFGAAILVISHDRAFSGRRHRAHLLAGARHAAHGEEALPGLRRLGRAGLRGGGEAGRAPRRQARPGEALAAAWRHRPAPAQSGPSRSPAGHAGRALGAARQAPPARPHHQRGRGALPHGDRGERRLGDGPPARTAAAAPSSKAFRPASSRETGSASWVRTAPARRR